MIYSGFGLALLNYIKGTNLNTLGNARLRYYDASGQDVTSSLVGLTYVEILSSDMSAATNGCVSNLNSFSLGTFQAPYQGVLEYRYFSSLDEPWFGTKLSVDIESGTVATLLPGNLTLCLPAVEEYLANLLLDYLFNQQPLVPLSSVYLQLLDGNKVGVSNIVELSSADISPIYQNEFNVPEMHCTSELNFTLSATTVVSSLRVSAANLPGSPLVLNYPISPMDFNAGTVYTIDAGKLIFPVLSESLTYLGAYVYDWLAVPSFVWVNMSRDIWKDLF